MKNKMFSLSYFGISFTAFMWILALFLIFEISSDFLAGIFESGYIPKTWGFILLLDLLFLAGAFIPTLSVLREFLTMFDEHGIQRPKLFGYSRIMWKDIVKIEERGFALYVKSNAEWIVISLSLYKKPGTVVRYIQNMVDKEK